MFIRYVQRFVWRFSLAQSVREIWLPLFHKFSSHLHCCVSSRRHLFAWVYQKTRAISKYEHFFCLCSTLFQFATFSCLRDRSLVWLVASCVTAKSIAERQWAVYVIGSASCRLQIATDESRLDRWMTTVHARRTFARLWAYSSNLLATFLCWSHTWNKTKTIK